MDDISELQKKKHREIAQAHLGLVEMLYRYCPIEELKAAVETIETYKAEQLNRLLDSAYTEFSYQSVGGDLGYQDNPPINYDALHYLDEVITWLESMGAQAD